jgi:site-specific recombinase XerC
MSPEVAKYDPGTIASADTQNRAERRLRQWLESLAPNTAIAYAADLAVFATHVGAHDQTDVPSPGAALGWLISLSRPDALEVAEVWQTAMVAQGLSSATINRRTIALNAALRHIAKGGVGPGRLDLRQIKHEARREVEAPSTGSIARVIEELSSSAAPADIRDTLVILLAAQRGLRKSEIAGLSTDDVDGAACTLKIRRKGHKEKIGLSIEGATCSALQRWLAIRLDHANTDEQALFVSLGNKVKGRALTGQSIYNVFRVRGGWHPHQLRHSAIQETLRISGNNLPLAQALAGHANSATTMGYIGRAERKRIESEAVGNMASVYRLAKLKSRAESD